MASIPTVLPTALPTAPVAAGGLIGGYLTARLTRRRPLGGAVLAAGGAVCTQRWLQRVGAGPAIGLLATYLAGFGLSHPLAKKIGAWPSVFTVAGISALAAWLVADRTK